MFSKPLRIALISEQPAPAIAPALARLGHRIDVLTGRDETAAPPVVLLQPGLRVLRIDAAQRPAFAHQAQRLLMDAARHDGAGRALGPLNGGACAGGAGYDIVHAESGWPGQVGLRLARRFGWPLVTSFRAGVPIERGLVQQSARLIAECPQVRDELLQRHGARPECIAGVPRGVDTTLFKPGDRAAARCALGLAADEFIVLQLGRSPPHEGVDPVRCAFERLPPQLPARLIAARVALPLHCVAADVVVDSGEAAGSMPLEAMACGTPVIAGVVGADALAAELLRLQRCPALARALGRGAMQRVRRHFSWDHVAGELESVYRALGRERSAPRAFWPAAAALRRS